MNIKVYIKESYDLFYANFVSRKLFMSAWTMYVCQQHMGAKGRFQCAAPEHRTCGPCNHL